MTNSQQHYDIAPEAIMRTPRHVRLRFRAQASRLLLFLGLLTWAGFSLYRAYMDLNVPIALWLGGKSGQATVIGREIIRPDAPTGYVHYAFSSSSGIIEDRVRVAHSEYHNAWTGAILEVTYLSANPRINRLGHVGIVEVLAQAAQTGLFLLPALLCLGWLFRRQETMLRRELRLARIGTPTLGSIVASQPLSERSGRPRYGIVYQFVLPEGDKQTGRAIVLARPAEFLPKGSTLAVLYDPAQPRHHRPFAAFRNVIIEGV